MTRSATCHPPEHRTKYVYDGMRVIQERDSQNEPKVCYTRGSDLSGTLEGAGGIGGLLARSQDFQLCTNVMTVRIVNMSPYTLTNWVWYSEDPVQFYQEGDWDFPILDDAEVYADALEVPPYEYRDVVFEAVAGRDCSLWCHGDYYYIWELGYNIPATQEYFEVGISSDPHVENYWFTSGNILCGEDLSGHWLTHSCYHADGNGNITCMVAANQAVVASYRYDPFGNTLSKSGALADANVYRFSSKEIHVPTGIYYYGYRFYDPSVQRWISRDPFGERGFETARQNNPSGGLDDLNAYRFVANRPQSLIDPLGLWKFKNCSPKDEADIRKDLAAKCAAAKQGNCFKCLSPANQRAMNWMCDDKAKGLDEITFACENANTYKDCQSTTPGTSRGGASVEGSRVSHICIPQPAGMPIGCSALHEAAHSVGRVGDDSNPRVKNYDQNAYQIQECAGCPKRPPGF